MNKIISLQEALCKIKDGMTIMVGGFLPAGKPHDILEALSKSDVKNLIVITNDCVQGQEVGLLIGARKVKKLITSYIGTNAEASAQMIEGSLEIEFSPQGTLVERIRCGGAGLGGVLTPTGMGTPVATGKPVIEVDGKQYLLEKPLRADVALITASVADEAGNCLYIGTTRNFNPTMATAADLVIVEAEKIVPVGSLDPSAVVTPSLFVDYIYQSSNKQIGAE